jgi:ABC-type phosphate transport system permease subunit
MPEMKFMKDHIFHGIALGAVTYAVTRSTPISFMLGIGASIYMLKYEHQAPWSLMLGE